MKEADNPTRLFASIKSLAANGRRNAEAALYEAYGLAEAGELMSERFVRERDTALRNERRASAVLIQVQDYARAVAGTEAALPTEIVREIESIIRGHDTPKVEAPDGQTSLR